MSRSTASVPKSGLSLQARLLVTVLGVLGVVWLAVAVSTWVDTGHELNELLDAHLSQAAALLVTQRLDDLEGDNFPPPPTLHRYQTRVAIQVWHEGRLVVRSTDAPDAPLAEGIKPGLSTQMVGGQAWRVLTTPGREADVVIHVGELESARRHILMASLRSTAWPMLLALPLLALGVWWAVRGAVGPLRQLGQAVAARRPESLEPLSAHAVPPEVAPLVAALNGLFDRMAELLASERRFTADAAHELRTPIAAIRMQAQVAQGASTEPERAQALAATLLGCDRAARLVEQLLQLARLEGEAARGGQAVQAGAVPTDLTTAARGLLAEFDAQARAKGQQLVLDAPGPVSVPVPAALAQVLLRNLIDNALRYSPDGAVVRVAIRGAASGKSAALVVEDSGPGLPPEALARLGERFFRVLGTGQAGSGLGWSIVQRVVRLYGMTVSVDRSEALGGLRVTLSWLDGSQTPED
jgi:two-component system, OmpR family, sensor histidine kinase QseC